MSRYHTERAELFERMLRLYGFDMEPRTRVYTEHGPTLVFYVEDRHASVSGAGAVLTAMGEDGWYRTVHAVKWDGRALIDAAFWLKTGAIPAEVTTSLRELEDDASSLEGRREA